MKRFHFLSGFSVYPVGNHRGNFPGEWIPLHRVCTYLLFILGIPLIEDFVDEGIPVL